MSTAQPVTAHPMTGRQSDTTRASGIGSFFLAAATLWQRELIRFIRQPSRVIGALGTPLIFWLLIGGGLGHSFKAAGNAGGDASYLSYFFPGTLLLILLFTAIFSSFSLIEDRREGFLQAVLVSPVSRGSIVLGKILGGTTLAVVQGLIFTALAPFAHITVSLLTGFEVAGISFLLSLGLTSLGFALAWPMESFQGFHGIMNLLLFPMWLLSGALFPAGGASGWIRLIMEVNPLTYGLSLLRNALTPAGMAGSPHVALSLTITILFALVTYAASWIMICRPRKTPH